MILKILQKLLGILNVPPEAIRYFRLSNKLSGLSKNNFPTELVPLNTKQLSRGMLNYTFFQHYPDWKRPFWAVKQYDPNYIGFIPRSHLAVSINVTNRNWTAIGNMHCAIEPIVDPCGNIVPFIDSWSIECWIKNRNQIIMPAYCKNINQKLIDDLPIVETIIIEKDFTLEIVQYTLVENLICEYKILPSDHQSDLMSDFELIISVRPFNFEGVSLINSLNFNKDENTISINNKNKIIFNNKPVTVLLSDLHSGDCANLLFENVKHNKNYSSNCCYGFANAIAIFKVNNNVAVNKKVSIQINLKNNFTKQFTDSTIELVKEYWQNILSQGSSYTLPDKKISSLVKNSLTTCLQFIDDDTVTPGPAIYHQFWFRDAVFQLNILDKLGFTHLTKNVIQKFFSYQKGDGYFRSQKGEWDSNGQVLWLIAQHALLSNDLSIIREKYSLLYKAIKWIDKNRLIGKKDISENYFGLLPKGLSAEHLGLADNYYWDNFWAIAGVKSFILICDLLGESNKKKFAEKLLNEYEKTLNESIYSSIKSNQYSVLPSAPSKTLDSGMIGSLIAVYPLQILDWDREPFTNSLNYVYKNYFNENLFFQDIIHSGGNPYITLQIAHSYLLHGRPDLFNKIFNDAVSYASQTLNFPEAIHPLTGGGVIGDGHHGWAAAEVLSSIRDLFVYEKNYYSIKSIELILLSGISKQWFLTNQELSIKNVKILSGSVSLYTIMNDNTIILKIDYLSNKKYNQEYMVIILPFIIKSMTSVNKEISISFDQSETTVRFNAESMSITFNI